MIDRRALLRLAAGAGTASLVAACGWDGGNAVRPLLLDVSRLNDWVGEKILFSKHRLAPEYDVAERTAVPMFPSYFISPMMPMLQDPKTWRVWGGGGGGRRPPARLFYLSVVCAPTPSVEQSPCRG